MAKHQVPTVIKKYANRRLYNTGTSTYVTLEDLGQMVKREEDFVVYDAKTGDDITHSVLTQIIFEQESKGQNLLPIAFLRQLIRFYGDSMQSIVPSYLEFSLSSLTRDQEKFRQHLSQTFGATAFDAVDDQVRRNAELFGRAMRMFNPFSAAAAVADDADDDADAKSAPEPDDNPDLDALRRQLQDMQKKIDALASDK